MKLPELAPLIDRRYWDGFALGDEADADEAQIELRCSKRHKMAEKAISHIYSTSRYPIALTEYKPGDVINADEHDTGAVLHLAEELITTHDDVPEITADELLMKPRLHPGGEYIPVYGEVNFPEWFNEGSLLVWNKYPGNSVIDETFNRNSESIRVTYLRHHMLAVADRGVFHVYNADALVRQTDGSLYVPYNMAHDRRTQICVDKTEIIGLNDDKISRLRRVNGGELITEGTTERKKAKVAFLAAFLNPVNLK